MGFVGNLVLFTVLQIDSTIF